MMAAMLGCFSKLLIHQFNHHRCGSHGK